jgi:hypothetical protein
MQVISISKCEMTVNYALSNCDIFHRVEAAIHVGETIARARELTDDSTNWRD